MSLVAVESHLLSVILQFPHAGSQCLQISAFSWWKFPSGHWRSEGPTWHQTFLGEANKMHECFGHFWLSRSGVAHSPPFGLSLTMDEVESSPKEFVSASVFMTNLATPLPWEWKRGHAPWLTKICKECYSIGKNIAVKTTWKMHFENLV